MASLDDQQERLTSEIKKILSREVRLNDAEWVLTRDTATIRRILKRYKSRLTNSLRKFVDSKAFDKMVNESIDQFLDSMAGFINKKDFKSRKGQRDRLLRSVRLEYSNLLQTSINSIIERQTRKATTFKVMSDLAQIPKALVGELDKVEVASIRTAEGRTVRDFNKKQLRSTWLRLTDRYGQHDTVIFKGGHKKPLETYVDGRTTTTRAEVDVLTTQLTAAANNILIGRINVTGTRDSCILHENRLVFFTETSKAEAIAKFPKHAAKFRKMPTVAELKVDDTHLFKFGCRHRVLAEGFQFQDEEEQDQQLKENAALPTVTKKTEINETKIKREIEAGKFAA